MDFVTIFIIAIGLAMDCFAVSICKGFNIKINLFRVLFISFWFGFFQGFMPFLGYLLGNTFKFFIDTYSGWISFLILLVLGISMIKESFDDEKDSCGFSIKEVFLLAIATSIDALSVGVTFSLNEVNILVSVIIIGIVTFIMSIIGLLIGYKIGTKYEKGALIFGGIVLILIGIKLLF